jgi:hypothetical protein
MIYLHLKDQYGNDFEPLAFEGDEAPLVFERMVAVAEPIIPQTLNGEDPLPIMNLSSRKAQFKYMHQFPPDPEPGEDIHAYYFQDEEG